MHSIRLTEAFPDDKTQSLFRVHTAAASMTPDGTANPTHLKHGDAHLFTFRDTDEGGTWLTISRGKDVEATRLDEKFKRSVRWMQGARLFEHDGKAWASFDTRAGADNRLFVCEVFPNLGKPVELIYPDRNLVERNWGLFDRDGEIFAVHSVSPFVLLRRVSHDDIRWEFELEHTDGAQAIPSMHVGSLPTEFAGDLYFMAHRTLPLQTDRKFVTLASLCRISSNSMKLTMYPTPIAHNIAELVGGTPARPHVKSSVFYSGLSFDGQMMQLAYGVNDHAAHFAEIQFDIAPSLFVPASQAATPDEIRVGKTAPRLKPTGPRSSGLGDTIAKVTKAVGIKPCGGCKKRQQKLNKLLPYKDKT